MPCLTQVATCVTGSLVLHSATCNCSCTRVAQRQMCTLLRVASETHDDGPFGTCNPILCIRTAACPASFAWLQRDSSERCKKIRRSERSATKCSYALSPPPRRSLDDPSLVLALNLFFESLRRSARLTCFHCATVSCMLAIFACTFTLLSALCLSAFLPLNSFVRFLPLYGPNACA